MHDSVEVCVDDIRDSQDLGLCNSSVMTLLPHVACYLAEFRNVHIVSVTT